MRKCSKKSKKTRTTDKLKNVRKLDCRELDRIKEEDVTDEYFKEKTKEGKYGCRMCDRYFQDEHTVAVHFKTKSHKKRVKEWKNEYHTQKDAEKAVGLNYL